MKFSIERRQLRRMLEAISTRAPGKRRPDKMVRLSAIGAHVFVEANAKAAGTETLVFAEGACRLVHETILRWLDIHARGRKYITFEADACVFRIDKGNWPVAAYSESASPPPEFQEFR